MMKYSFSEIYNIGRRVLKNSTVGFDEFLENSIFNYISENSYLMKRPKEEISAWVLLDFNEFKKSATNILEVLLHDTDVPEKDFEGIINILQESYVSLFEIEKNGEEYTFHDLLLNEEFSVKYSKALINLVHNKGLFRIMENNGERMVLQTIRLMDDKEFFTFNSSLLNLFEELKNKFSDFKMNKDTLKLNLLNMLTICEITIESLYGENDNNFLFEFSDYEIDEAFYDKDLIVLTDLRDFKNILHTNDEYYVLSFFDNTFTKIYRQVLEDEEKSFKNYNLDYKVIFYKLCYGGEFSDSNELIESVDIVTLFYKKLKKFGRKVDKILESLESVKKNIFDYIKVLDNSIHGFYYGENLPQLIASNNPNVYSNKFVENYDNFLTFLDINYVNLLTSGDLSPAMLRGFVEDAEIEPTRYVKVYKNKHFPLIELYLCFTILKSLTYLYNPDEVQEIYLTDEADRYMQFDDLEKLSIWIDVLTKEDFLKAAFGNNFTSYRDIVLNLFEDLNNGNDVYYDDYKDLDKPIINILLDLDLIEDKKTLKFTKFGLAIYNYYRVDKPKDNIIEVDFN